jgi:hypothetical protein
VFVAVSDFWTSLIFAIKVRTYPSRAHNGTPLQGLAPHLACKYKTGEELTDTDKTLLLIMVQNRHDHNRRFSKHLSCLKIYYSRLTPVISHLLIVNTMLTNSLETGQAVLELRHLIPDPLAVLTFDHAWCKINYRCRKFYDTSPRFTKAIWFRSSFIKPAFACLHFNRGVYTIKLFTFVLYLVS